MEEKWARIGDLDLHYLDSGGNQDVILMLHGLASSCHWYDLISPFLTEHHRLIIPDQRGHGKTTQASNGYDWYTLSRDVMALVDELGLETVTVAGHSWGGNVAINIAAYYPDRIKALIMIDGGFFTPEIMPGATWDQFRSRLSPRKVEGTRDEYLAYMKRGLEPCWSQEVQRILLTMVWEDVSGQVVDILKEDNHAQIVRAMWEYPASTTWSKIVCPTLIIPAESVRMSHSGLNIRKKVVELAHEAIEDSEVFWMRDTIHDIGWDKPAELAFAIDQFVR